MKNTLAMVMAIARQTLRSVPDQAPIEAFSARLQALSSAHVALLQQRWTEAKIYEVVRSVLGAIETIDRFDLSGPAVELGSARDAVDVTPASRAFDQCTQIWGIVPTDRPGFGFLERPRRPADAEMAGGERSNRGEPVRKRLWIKIDRNGSHRNGRRCASLPVHWVRS